MATLTLSSKLAPFPFAVIAIAAYTQKAELVFDDAATGPVLELNGSQITAEQDIVHALAKEGGLSEDSAKAASFFALAKNLNTVTVVSEVITALDSLDDHLAYRTFLIGHAVTASDWMLWGTIKGSIKIVGLLKNNKHAHLNRWFSHLESLESTQTALTALISAKASKARSNKVAAGFALGLEGAKMGEVVTRFPPEPSGYLHIGHAKAAMLNQYFAQMYNGKLIIRFDDTNPSKERDTILETCYVGNQGRYYHSHVDYFATLYDYALKVIKEGKAYTDDTEQAQMRTERFDGIASKHRDDSVEDNLKHFAEMTAGSEEGLRWCLRAKMSVDDPNKALRDPVIYRCNTLPHHRTGDKWKVYPTYDFACPIVDSIEGVTHALRTNEYRDRNPQYWWMTDAVGIRKVKIWDFSRLNFIYTLLSKRKLHDFVNRGIVRGWDDPRFPTVRGIRRRGLTIEALHQFMLMQGPSQAIVSLEWDSIWAMNKKVIDPIAPRHWAIIEADRVPVTVKGAPTTPEVKNLPKHKKNPEIGEKKTVYSSNILVDQEDALSFEDQEEVTLMDWGNAIVRSKTLDASGKVTSIEMELHLEGDFKKTKKKITWLAQPTDALPLIPKLEEGDDVVEFTAPVSEFRESALADANVKDLKKGDYLQFERKGYFIFDGEGGDGKIEFIRIPDGKAAGLASKAGVAAAATPKEITTPASKMYSVDSIYGDQVPPDVDTKMYKVESIYKN
ncbi:glutamate-tRNA ligase [Mucidula mucida]|nr:glutamate-tRNA ligase [Mucidula mucida]